MSNEKIWQQSDGNMYLNNGPINPVMDVKAAHSMALAEENAVRRHEAAKAKVAEIAVVDPTGNSVIPDRNTVLTANADINKTRDIAAEKIRSNIGGQNIERGKILFDLVKLERVDKSAKSHTR